MYVCICSVDEGYGFVFDMCFVVFVVWMRGMGLYLTVFCCICSADEGYGFVFDMCFVVFVAQMRGTGLCLTRVCLYFQC